MNNMPSEDLPYSNLFDQLGAYDAPGGYTLIAEITFEWGDLLLRSGNSADGKRVAADLWKMLQRPEYAFTDEPPTGDTHAPKGSLSREDCVSESKKWARVLHERPYPEAIAGFMDVVYRWLHQADLAELKMPDRSFQDKRKGVYSWWGAWLGVD